jgi:hypothetical protein
MKVLMLRMAIVAAVIAPTAALAGRIVGNA